MREIKNEERRVRMKDDDRDDKKSGSVLAILFAGVNKVKVGQCDPP